MHVFFALIETQGNQRYVFSSNREKAVRGASELLFRSTTDWVIDAVTGTRRSRSLDERASWIRSQGPIGDGVHVVVATSGRAALIATDGAALSNVVTDITSRALREAPGLTVAGAVVDLDLDARRGFDDAFHRARVRLGPNSAMQRPAAARHPLRPVVRTCDETGLAATRLDRSKNRWVSAQFGSQVAASGSSWNRLAGSSAILADNVDEVVGERSWRAVVYADGNGVGRIFSELAARFAPDHLGAREGNLNHIEGYRELSLELERATEDAFTEALTLAGLPEGSVMPILLGGDDIIAQVAAAWAVPFTRGYLEAFERTTAAAGAVVARYSRSTDGETPRHFTACAGVAVVKAHFPFGSAADLAESLLDSAKTAKDSGRVSAFDFHVSYDSTSSDLDVVRGRRTAADGLRLWGGPYVLADSTAVGTVVARLDSACDALQTGGNGTQVHAMREAARVGKVRLAHALDNAITVAGGGRRADAMATLAEVADDRVLLLDALELGDIERKGGSR